MSILEEGEEIMLNTISRTVWMIFHCGDNKWIYKKTRVLKYVNGMPFVELTQRVTSHTFLFITEKKARKAARRMNDG